MGVRGLTSYIARNADRFLQPYELHDCDLIVDGDNLACNLYKDSGCNSAFGGDYDQYYRTVVQFFQLLAECNVRAFVLLDGGYEAKKLKTAERRLRIKVGIVKYLNPADSKPIFPLMMREVFIDAVRDCGVQVMRCIFEADDEIAVLARKLNCPVLSYDSDFYIHNVKYIPLITLTYKVYEKEVDIESSSTKKEPEKLRKSEGKRVVKRKKFLRRLKSQQSVDKESVPTSPVGKTVTKKTMKIKYLDCCIYTIESLLKMGSLKSEMLPIFAALIGNDYIDRESFKNFYSQVSMKGTSKRISRQQRRIIVIMRWLQHETKESAMQKILSKIKAEHRGNLTKQIHAATDGYSREESKSYEFFGLSRRSDTDEQDDGSETEIDPENANDNNNGDNGDGSDCDDDPTDSEQSDFFEEDSNSTDAESEDSQSSTEVEVEEFYDSDNGKSHNFASHCRMDPEIEERVLNAELPRYINDLVHLRLYINNPQIENFHLEDANLIALDILKYLFYLLHMNKDCILRYLSRVGMTTSIKYTKVFSLCDLYNDFDPTDVDLVGFKKIFDRLSINLLASRFKKYPTIDDIFRSIVEIPSNLRLYFLAIIYWSIKTKQGDEKHLHCIIVCLIALGVIDTKIEPIREEKTFAKKFARVLKTQRSTSSKSMDSMTTSANDSQNSKSSKKQEKAEKIQSILGALPVTEKVKYVSKNECILVQENLLKFFHFNENFRKRHNDFSTQIIHGFSEFQSVLYHLHALNLLFNCPFETVRISQFYNGLFLYNMYVSLKDRPDLNFYVENFIFQKSPILRDYYRFLIDWCKRFFPVFKFTNNVKSSKKVTRKEKKRNSIRDRRESLVEDLIESTTDSEMIENVAALRI